MIKVEVEINGRNVYSIGASRIGRLTGEPGETHTYSSYVVDHEQKIKAEFRVMHQYDKGALKLAKKLCNAAAKQV